MAIRILLVKTSSMGDVIHNLPVISDIKGAMPDAAVDWVVEEAFVDIVRLHPGVRDVMPVAWRRWRRSLTSLETWSEMRDFRYRLKRTDYDYVIDTQGLLKSAVIAKMANAASRCGYAREVAREPWAAKAYDNPIIIPKNAHAVERNRWLVGASLDFFIDEHRLDYGLKVTPVSRDFDEPYAVFIHGTSRTDKQWPVERWIELGKRFNAAGRRVVLPWGTEDEHTTARTIAGALDHADVLPKLKLDALAAWLSGAEINVGVDTGLSHLSAALARPTIGVYTASFPDLTGVYAGKRGVNLGGPGQCPSVEAIDDESRRLLKRLLRQ